MHAILNPQYVVSMLRLVVLAAMLALTVPAYGETNTQSWFTKQLDSPAYASMLEEVSSVVHKKLQRPNSGPATTYGIKIIAVKDAGQADLLGLELGSIMIAVDDVPVFERADFLTRRAGQAQTEITWISPDGTKKKATFEQGLLGVTYSDARELVAWYARSDHRNEAWDKHVYGALAILEKWFTHHADQDIDFVETALAHAVEAGMPDSAFLRSLAAEVLWHRGTLAQAWPYIKSFPMPSNTNDPLLVPSRRLDIVRASRANKYAVELVRHGLINRDAIMDHDALKNWCDEISQQPDERSPIERVKARKQLTIKSINDQITPDKTGPFFHRSDWFAKRIALNKPPARIRATPAHYDCSAMRLADLFDYDITMTFRVKTTGPSSDAFPNFLTFGLYDREYAVEKKLRPFTAVGAASYVQMKFLDDVKPQISFGASPFYATFLNPQLEIDKTGQTLHTIRMTHLLGDVQIQIDGVTVLDTYTRETSGDMVLYLHVVGLELTDIHIQIDQIEWELDSDA